MANSCIFIASHLQVASAVSIFRNFPILIAKMKPSVNSELVISLAKHLSVEKSMQVLHPEITLPT